MVAPVLFVPRPLSLGVSLLVVCADTCVDVHGEKSIAFLRFGGVLFCHGGRHLAFFSEHGYAIVGYRRDWSNDARCGKSWVTMPCDKSVVLRLRDVTLWHRRIC